MVGVCGIGLRDEPGRIGVGREELDDGFRVDVFSGGASRAIGEEASGWRERAARSGPTRFGAGRA